MAAAVASATPMSFSSSANQQRRPLARSTTRSAYSESYRHGSSAGLVVKSLPKNNGTGDSSDDDDLAPIKLSAEAQAILGEDSDQQGPDKESISSYRNTKLATNGHIGLHGTTPVEKLRASAQANGSPAPRVVRSAAPPRSSAPSSVARDGSFMYKTHNKDLHQQTPLVDQSDTPKTRRVVRVGSARQTSRSPTAAAHTAEAPGPANNGSEARHHQPHSPLGATRHAEDEFHEQHEQHVGPSTIMRSRRGDDNGVQSTRLVKRIGVGSMRVKPVRRGMARRPSEDDKVDHDRQERSPSGSPEIEVGRTAKEPALVDDPILAPSPPRNPERRSPALLLEGTNLCRVNPQDEVPPGIPWLSFILQTLNFQPQTHL
ncbi:hypothetical protein DV736_g5802, partial [Chaetothyriales sp. CBS 134916]